MNRRQFDELIFQIGQATGLREISLVGGQSALGSYDERALPAAATRSLEIDAVLVGHRALGSVLALLGQGSDFERATKVSVDPVGLATAFFPQGWEARRLAYHPASAPYMTAWCPEIHDLVASKLSRLETHDKEFASALMSARLVAPARLETRIPSLTRMDGVPLSEGRKRAALAWVRQERARLGL